MTPTIDYERLRRHVKVRFTCKAATAAAISEINCCEQMESYQFAVLHLYPTESAYDAILAHAITRGALWESKPNLR
jgi:hypothetical protein